MKIFTYGTLKQGGILHKYMKDAKYIKQKKISGYVLYLAPNKIYPLLYYTGNKKDVVVGEIWKINKKNKSKLDKYEEGYLLKKLMKSPIMTYYPNFDIKHLCDKIPKNSDGRYEFNVEMDFYKEYNSISMIKNENTATKNENTASMSY
jgi:gamma-glutamylcyclotransferase (GGCT)/AIG2-like uncharacterized protein YtfP